MPQKYSGNPRNPGIPGNYGNMRMGIPEIFPEYGNSRLVDVVKLITWPGGTLLGALVRGELGLQLAEGHKKPPPGRRSLAWLVPAELNATALREAPQSAAERAEREEPLKKNPGILGIPAGNSRNEKLREYGVMGMMKSAPKKIREFHPGIPGMGFPGI
ncbi:hypothetical protein T492DRAFT_836474 [Pavlovales sp. CCMP2436]|nr:hypothetical protein T492DRAFT_836474 [Pavlovales sp. CCMP2436]